MNKPTESSGKHRRLMPMIGMVFLTGLIVMIGISSGFGTRLGLWNFRIGFTMLRWAVYGSLGLVIFDIYLIMRTITRPGLARWLGIVLLVILIGFLTLPLSWYSTARSVPPIHDITTDTNNPPAFDAIVPLRKNAPNPLDYPGEEVAKQQKEAYPEIRPLIFRKTSNEVYPIALEKAKEMNWEIISANPRQGRIEAVDTTFWFGFKDDIVVRLAEVNDQTRVDVRSKSRVGKSDVGTNARRIQQYQQRLKTYFNR